MSREELIEVICPYHDDSCGGDQKCEDCDAELNELLDKYNKEVIKEFTEWLKKHCNSDGYIGRGRFDELLAEYEKEKTQNEVHL